MPRMRTETFGAGDQSWLGSDHGIFNCRTGTLDVSTFVKADHYPDGYFRAGTIVNAADEGAVKPFTGAVGEVFAVLFTDQPTDGVADVPAPILMHGIVKTDKLPVTANLPATAPNGFAFTVHGA